MLASRLFLERRIASKVSYIRKRMHELGGTGRNRLVVCGG